VPVADAGGSLQVGDPSVLFQTQIGPTTLRTFYEVGPDGRFLFYVPDDGGLRSPITVILNWAGLKTGSG
jgi:hypothetical protein